MVSPDTIGDRRVLLDVYLNLGVLVRVWKKQLEFLFPVGNIRIFNTFLYSVMYYLENCTIYYKIKDPRKVE